MMEISAKNAMPKRYGVLSINQLKFRTVIPYQSCLVHGPMSY